MARYFIKRYWFSKTRYNTVHEATGATTTIENQKVTLRRSDKVLKNVHQIPLIFVNKPYGRMFIK